jgi:Flp pilus assembly protein TadD
VHQFSAAFAVVLLLAGCVTQTGMQSVQSYPAELLDGSRVFGEAIEPAPPQDLLSVSTAMTEFVASIRGEGHFESLRFRRLMRKLVQDGFFIDQYDRDASYSAAKTFAERKGNCLAYTNMFVALAREAGLNAKYQLVETQPTWDVESGFLVRYNHVNVLLEGLKSPGNHVSDITVDFNIVRVADDVPRTTIGDAYAESMFYGNLAVEQLHKGDHRTAFSYLKRAVLTEPANSDAWNNLGALYSIKERPELGQLAYETAMSLSKRNATAISGLAKSLRQQGKHEQADQYETLAAKYQGKNPYYHFAVAEQAFRNDAFEIALHSVEQAISLQRDNARFYALRAATAEELGDLVLQQKSIRLQRKHTDDSTQARDLIFN